jgi:hypothetical protein
MVDAQARQLAQPMLVRREVGCVDLRVPPDEVVDAQRKVDVQPAATMQVEAHGAHAGGVERADLVVRDGRRELRDADEAGPQPRERVEQVRLVVGLERAGDDGAPDDLEPGRARPVVGDRERLRRVALVGDQPKPRVDDVEVAVEERGQPAIGRLMPTGCGGDGACITGSSTGAMATMPRAA